MPAYFGPATAGVENSETATANVKRKPRNRPGTVASPFGRDAENIFFDTAALIACMVVVLRPGSAPPMGPLSGNLGEQRYQEVYDERQLYSAGGILAAWPSSNRSSPEVIADK